MSRRGRIALKAIAWVLCLLPLAVLLHLAVQGELGANPISFVTNWLGQWTFRLLLVSLALTPLRILFGLAWPLQLRRLVGLFAFCYACLHLSVWVVLDHYFDWGEMWADLLKRRYITAGMAALTLLVPLAAPPPRAWCAGWAARPGDVSTGSSISSPSWRRSISSGWPRRFAPSSTSTPRSWRCSSGSDSGTPCAADCGDATFRRQRAPLLPDVRLDPPVSDPAPKSPANE